MPFNRLFSGSHNERVFFTTSPPVPGAGDQNKGEFYQLDMNLNPDQILEKIIARCPFTYQGMYITLVLFFPDDNEFNSPNFVLPLTFNLANANTWLNPQQNGQAIPVQNGLVLALDAVNREVVLPISKKGTSRVVIFNHSDPNQAGQVFLDFIKSGG